jgi:peptidoglycan/LPS O-acetylase OafA/YrhL
MYVLLPFIFMAARRLRSQFGAAVLVAGGFALWWMEARVAAVFGYQPLFSYAPWFAMGCAAYVLGKTAKPSVSSAWYVFCLSGFVGLALLANRTIRGYRYGWAIWGLGILFAFALPHFKDVTAAPLRRMAHSIATYSYGLYLWHVPILWLAFQKLHQLPRGAQFAICVVLLIVLPYFLHRFVESPMIILGARIARSSERTRPQTGILGREANQSASA